VPEWLTDATIKALEPRGERYEVTDEGEAGLRLRVLPSGERVWSYWYRNRAGASRRLRLGVYPDVTLTRARKLAREHSVAVGKGDDPAAAREKARADRKARAGAARVADLCDAFVKDQAAGWRHSTRAGWIRYLEADIKPSALGKKIPAEVTAEDVVAFVEALQAKRGAVSVARCFEVVRRLFRWAVARRKLTSDPCSGLDAKELVAKAETSTRTFADLELVAILAAAAVTELRLLVPWVLYTGARGGEARSAEWADIDLQARLWTIPAAKSKSGETHRVPLSEGALAVLHELRGRDGWLFPAPTREGFMDRSQKTVERVRALSGIEDFNLHHLRRTLRQRLTDAGVALHVGEAIIGHLPPKIVRTYSPEWEPLREMRSALETWARELSRIARGEERQTADVVPMVRA